MLSAELLPPVKGMWRLPATRLHRLVVWTFRRMAHSPAAWQPRQLVLECASEATLQDWLQRINGAVAQQARRQAACSLLPSQRTAPFCMRCTRCCCCLVLPRAVAPPHCPSAWGALPCLQAAPPAGVCQPVWGQPARATDLGERGAARV